MNRIHRTLRRAATVFVTAAACVACFSLSAAAAQPGSVISDSAKLREDSAISGDVLATLEQGDALEILGSSNSDWLLVNYIDEDGETISGYIDRSDAVIGVNADALTNHAGVTISATVNDGGVVLCDEPESDNTLLTIAAGETVLLLSEADNGWLQVAYRGEAGNFTGYIPADAVVLNAMAYGYTGEQPTLLYNDPMADATSLAALDANVIVAVLDVLEGWYSVRYENYTGYIKAEELNLIHEATETLTGTVSADELRLRKNASSRSSTLTRLEEGALFTITSTAVDGWYATRYNGKTGYVSADYVELAEDMTGGYVQVTVPSLPLLAGMYSTCATLTQVPVDTVLQIIDCDGSWYQVSYNGCTGFIHSAYVCATGEDGWRTYPEYVKITANSTLGLREAPHSDADRLARISRGTIVAVDGKEDGWYVVSYNGKTGYIDPAYTVESGAPVAEVSENGVSSGSSKYEGGSTMGSGSGSDVVAFASQFVGNRYVWGGTSLTNGVDCSGFVMKVYEHFGVDLPHSSYSMRSCGKSVSYSEMQPGDIVCYDGHVGIYAGGGKIVNALNSKKGITYTDVNYDTILTIRRIFD